MSKTSEIHVIGGGIGGLAAAAYLARAGRRVRVYERSSALGGRARSARAGECLLNLGPHALYAKGAAAEVLDELGVAYRGGMPRGKGAYALRGGRAHTMPAGLVSLLSTGLLSLADKLALARVLTALPKLDPARHRGTSLRAWVEDAAAAPEVRAFLYALARLATYANAPDRVDAGAAIAQMQRALGGVLYLDGGWQTLVDGLRDAALAAGAEIATRARIGSLAELEGPVVLATPPAEAGRLLGRTWDLVPVHAACLDVALSALPVPHAQFALGMDAPTYFSVHSQHAKLGPGGAAVLHVAKYLAPEAQPDPAGDRAQLEAVLDLVQPGWRALVREQRSLPRMIVSHALVTSAGRPAGECQGVHLVGDWVGPEGMLADAALASARSAARALLTAADDGEQRAA
ncbi:FAD-dependent oxidoreductase [Haliangium ochraceum]|uniref:FAD dependent oxidoreductase n=1 Tax=Haliangium ochraceum (strain DSM 14365 / JCM 11303 / SMP-2) TaxID=502025 RepID=D0LVU1_HALO1|nr:FAD-dependent oxidoreductase [Haliangium ochraceum]ACY14075.1 FAD dependent oxidoreductase [Haliangium ochraceum DSM 14365]